MPPEGNMDAKTQYLQYKQPLKKQCIVQIVASAVALLATVFLLFLPNFSIDTLTVLFAETTLPKLHDEAAFMGSQINFSIWDEFYAVIAPVTGEDSTARTLALSFGFLQILGIIFLAVGLIMALVSVIRNIMHILSLENYALETYDKLKKRTEKRGRRGYFSSPTYWIIIGFVYEVMAVLLSIYLTDLTEGSIVTSYFSVMSGLAASGYITILFMLAAVVLVIVGGQMLRKVKVAILREEYGLQDGSAAQPQPYPQQPYGYAPDGQPYIPPQNGQFAQGVPQAGQPVPPQGAAQPTAAPYAPTAAQPQYGQAGQTVSAPQGASQAQGAPQNGIPPQGGSNVPPQNGGR